MRLLLALLLLPSTAAASPAVLFAEGQDAAAAAVAAHKALGDVGEVLALAQALGDDGPLVVGASLRRCPADAAPPEDITALRGLVDRMDYAGARAALTARAAALPCGAAGPDDAYEIFFLTGIAAFFEGDEASARDAFSAAAALDPTRAWNDRFPPAPKPVFLEALQAIIAAGTVALSVDGYTASLDGRAVPDAVGRSGHWLTLNAVDGWLEPAPDAAAVRIQSPAAWQSGVLAGDTGALEILREVAAREGWTSVALARDTGLFVLEAGGWAPATAATRAGPPPRRVAGVGVLVAGAAVGAVGLGVNLQTWRRISPAPCAEDHYCFEDSTLTPADTQRIVRSNHAAFGAALAGGATALAGLIVAVVPQPARTAWVPWVAPAAGGARFGIQGRF